MEVRQLKPRKIADQPKKKVVKQRLKHGSLQSFDNSYEFNHFSSFKNIDEILKIPKHPLRPKVNNTATISSINNEQKTKQKKNYDSINYQSLKKLPNYKQLITSVEITPTKLTDRIQNSLYSTVTNNRFDFSHQQNFYFSRQQPGQIAKNPISQFEKSGKNYEFKTQNEKKLEKRIQKIETLLQDNIKLIQELSSNSIRKTQQLIYRYVQKDDFERVFHNFQEIIGKLDRQNQVQTQINQSNECKFAALSQKLLKYRSQMHKQAKKQSGLVSQLEAMHSSFVSQQHQQNNASITKNKRQKDQKYVQKIIDQAIQTMKHALNKQINSIKSIFRIKENLKQKIVFDMKSKFQVQDQQTSKSSLSLTNKINLHSLELSQSLQSIQKGKKTKKKIKNVHKQQNKRRNYSQEKVLDIKDQQHNQIFNERNTFLCNLNTQSSEGLMELHFQQVFSQRFELQNSTHCNQKGHQILIEDKQNKYLQAISYTDEIKAKYNNVYLPETPNQSQKYLDYHSLKNENSQQLQTVNPIRNLILKQPDLQYQRTYFLDQSGLLYDFEGRIIQNSQKKPIRISQTQIQKLSEAKMLKTFGSYQKKQLRIENL